MTKAEQKRIKENTEIILSKVNSTLLQFKNDVMCRAGEWAVKEKEIRLENAQKDLKAFCASSGYGEHKADQYANRIVWLEKELQKSTLISFEAMKEFEENYTQKVQKMVEKMVRYGMTHLHLQVKSVKTEKPGEFSFLVSNNEMEVHARAIYVNGTIVAPHFRFITTKRMIK
jgi:hypothetical protein